MARIQYTRYQFQRPNLITKQDYDDIKKSNDYNDFKQKMEKYLIGRYGLSKDTLILRN